MQNVLARVRNPALRQGLIFGIILGIILLAVSFISNGLIITMLLCILAAFIASLRASQETGRLITGTLAGLWTGLLGVFIPSLVSMVLLLINIDAIRKSAQATADKQHIHVTYTNSLLLEGLVINFLILLLFGVVFGVIGGAVGGGFGARRAQLAPVEEYHEDMFESPSETQTEEALSENTLESPSSPKQAE